MINAAMIFNNSFYTQQTTLSAKKTSDTGAKISFQAQVTDTAGKGQKKEYANTVEDYKRRHPEYAAMVDGQVRAGKEVLRRNGVESVERDSMTMEEYKRFFIQLMNSIPYDSSQIRDTNVWSITEKGWEQMKNDSDYEAWILGYTSQDRSFHNPWASMPGYKPGYHTEHFGASIEEHLGQSFPVSDMEEKDKESWWEKRHKRMKKIAEEQEEKAIKENAEKMKIQREQWKQMEGKEYSFHVPGAMLMSTSFRHLFMDGTTDGSSASQ